MKRRIIGWLGGFLALMLLFTFLSRAADSVTVPKVQTQAPEKRKITHPVSGSGKVVQNQERAVRTEEGQIVKAIHVEEGAQVEEGDLLFELDLEELKEQILLGQQELEKLKLQEADADSQQEASASKQETARARASQDYQDAVSEGDAAVQEAAQQLQRAKKELESAQKGTTVVEEDETVRTALKEAQKEKEKEWERAREEKKSLETSIEEEVKKKQEAAQEAAGETELTKAQKQELEAQVRQSYEKALQQAEKKEEQAEQEKEKAQEALDQYEAEQESGKEQAASANVAQLAQNVEEKQAAYEAALSEREAAVQAAQRALEDSQAKEGTDSTADINAIDRRQKELALEKLKKLQKAKGRVTSPVKGVVTKISLTVGERTPDGTAMLLADLSQGCKLVVQIPSDQEKYIARNDAVTVTPSGNEKKLTDLKVDAIGINEQDESMLDVTISLPEGALELGTAATAQIVREEQAYSLCVPIQALYQGEQNQYYVLVTQEEETVMGTQMTAKRINVTVLDKNATYAALSEESLSASQDVIIESDRVLEDGDRVRMEEA